MGGSTSTTDKSSNSNTFSSGSSSSTTNPWAAAQPLLGGILGKLGGALDTPALTPAESAALSALEANAHAGNPWAPQIGGVAATLLAGGGPDRSDRVQTAYDALDANLGATARGDYLDPGKNPFFSTLTGTLSNDITNRVNGMFAGAGRDLSGANLQTLARGISEGTAPVFADQWNRERGNQINAANTLYNAGNTTAGILSGFDQARLANQQAGIGAADAAFAAQSYGPAQLLAAEAQRRGIPMSALAQLVEMGVPIAGLGQSTASNSVGSSAGSGTSGNQEHAVQSVVARAAGIRAVHGRRQPGRGRRERARNRPLRHAARVECALFHEVNPWLESFPISSAAMAAAACSGR
jgi:hypothetical protein